MQLKKVELTIAKNLSTKYGLLISFFISGLITFFVAYYFKEIFWIFIILFLSGFISFLGGMILTLEYFEKKGKEWDL